jgi:hypothetical protein
MTTFSLRRTAFAGAVLIAACAAQLATAAVSPATTYDPGGNPSADVRTPPPGGQYFGFSGTFSAYNTVLSGYGASAPQEYFPAYEAGSNSQRLDVPWFFMEPSAPVAGQHAYSPAQLASLDLRVAWMGAFGLRPLLMVDSAPQWATDYHGCGSSCWAHVLPTGHLAQWKTFLTFLAQRYPTAMFEINNEPNLDWATNPSPDADGYYQVLKAGYQAIKAVGNDRIVVSGGLADNLESVNGDIAFKPYAQRLYDLGLKRDMPDLRFGYHVYPHSQPLDQVGAQFADGISVLRQILTANQDRGREVWVTETGTTTGGYSLGSLVTTPAQQKTQLLATYRRLMTMSQSAYGGTDNWPLKVKAMYIHTIKDNWDIYGAGPNSWNSEYFYGVMYDWTHPKPALCAFVALQPAGAGRSFSGC